MATATQISRVQYRSSAARLTAVAKAAEELLNIYTWENTDGHIQFTTEPNPASISSPELFDHEVKSAWAGLRAALIAAGVITGESTPGFLPGGEAQFLRVQTLNVEVASVVWQTRAVYEVATGVNSYGYADGKALDLFYMLRRKFAVRVLRQCVALEHREDYLRGDVHDLTREAVIGHIDPFSTPNVATGWACIGDMSANPEPDFFGLDSPRLIVIPTGFEGPQGIRGEVGERGLRGFVGPAGSGGGAAGGGGGRWFWKLLGVVEQVEFSAPGVLEMMPLWDVKADVQDTAAGVGLLLDGAAYLRWMDAASFDFGADNFTIDVVFSVLPALVRRQSRLPSLLQKQRPRHLPR